MKLKRVEIHWVDSAGSAKPWINKDRETLSIDAVVSIGYLVSRDKRQVLLAQSRSTSELGHPLAIPASSITKVKRLKALRKTS